MHRVATDGFVAGADVVGDLEREDRGGVVLQKEHAKAVLLQEILIDA